MRVVLAFHGMWRVSSYVQRVNIPVQRPMFPRPFHSNQREIHAMRSFGAASAWVLIVLCGGCEEERNPPSSAARPASSPKQQATPVTGSAPAPLPSSSAAPVATNSRSQTRAFIDEKHEVPPGMEWNREAIARGPGTISYRVESQGPFSVTILTGAAFKSLMAKDMKAINRADVLFTADFPGPTYEGKVTLPAGSTYFMLKNGSSKPVQFHLQCFPGA